MKHFIIIEFNPYETCFDNCMEVYPIEIVKRCCLSSGSRGRKGGRLKANQKAVEKAVKLYKTQTHSIREIVAISSVSQATLYRALAEGKA